MADRGAVNIRPLISRNPVPAETYLVNVNGIDQGLVDTSPLNHFIGPQPIPPDPPDPIPSTYYINWDSTGKRIFETGIDRVVLYPEGKIGVPWFGVTGIDEGNEGGELKSIFIDGLKSADVVSTEIFSATLACLSIPDDFGPCMGYPSLYGGALLIGQQSKDLFNLTYRTKIGNDVDGLDHGYKLHFVYNCTVDGSDRNYSTLSQTPDVVNHSFPIKTVPELFSYPIYASHIVLDSTKTNRYLMAYLEEILYGSETETPRIPSAMELKSIIDNFLVLEVIDNGDGTFTYNAPDDILIITGDSFTLDWPYAEWLNSYTYRISSGV